MLQTIEGKTVEVVTFDTMPELPITGFTPEEAVYDLLTDKLLVTSGKYAKALTNAIETGVITEPGKYGIYLVPGTLNYVIFTIIE